ncbi:MAG: DUF3486 family protein [Planctomycetes bacterium]|nr:DUF3486 family protein [Planctomycetota bacterium]
MPKRSAVSELPTDMKAWLDQELIKRGFSGYQELEALLTDKGYKIGKSSIHRYGERLEQQVRNIKASRESAKALAEAAGDDEDAVGQALVAMIQEKFMNLLMGLEDAKVNPMAISRVARAMKDLSKASLGQKRWADEVKQKAKTAASAIKKTAKKGGLSDELIKEIEEEVLGIVR